MRCTSMCVLTRSLEGSKESPERRPEEWPEGEERKSVSGRQKSRWRWRAHEGGPAGGEAALMRRRGACRRVGQRDLTGRTCPTTVIRRAQF